MKLIITLYPFAAMGGGEIFTASLWRSLVATDSEWSLAIPLVDTPDHLSEETPFILYSDDGNQSVTIRTAALGQLMMEMTPMLTHLWVHQFAASSLIYDLCFSSAPFTQLFVTNLGCDPLLQEFGQIAGHLPNLKALEISGYSAERSKAAGIYSKVVTAGIWKHELRCVTSHAKKIDFVSVGRCLPHKGFDVTLRSLAADYSLVIIGNLEFDRHYSVHLKQLACDKSVSFSGSLEQSTKNSMVASSRFLIASSTHCGYDGTVYQQAELLGLVIFEALSQGTLPITSDIPSFLEVMRALELEDLTYPEGDVTALSALMSESLRMPSNIYHERLTKALKKVVEHFLWDDFPQRFQKAIAE